jgi:chromosomal replication initiation ATPase DnaA
MAENHDGYCPETRGRRRRRSGGATVLQDQAWRAEELRALIEATVASGFDIDEQLLRQPSRGEARIALARQAAMYLGHVCCGLSKTEAGRLFERDRTTVHHACIVIEQRRECQSFDRALDHLERVIRIVVGPQEAPCPPSL